MLSWKSRRISFGSMCTSSFYSRDFQMYEMSGGTLANLTSPRPFQKRGTMALHVE